MAATAEQLRRKAEGLHRVALGHVELQRRHRQSARAAFAEMNAVIERAARQGITINITKPKGGQGESSSNTQDTR